MRENERIKQELIKILDQEGLEEDLAKKLADKIYNNLVINQSFNGAKIEGNVIINHLTPEELKAEEYARDTENYLHKTRSRVKILFFLGISFLTSGFILLMSDLHIDYPIWLPILLILGGAFFSNLAGELSQKRVAIYHEYFNRIYELAPHRKDLLKKLKKAL